MEINKEVAEESLKMLKSTTGFVIEQTTDVCQQLLKYEFIMLSLYTVGSVLIFGAGLFLLNKCFKCKGDLENEPALLIPTVVFLMFGIIGICSNTGDLVKVKVAPKVFLIEKLTRMVK
jgi:hypothetical protein